MSLASSQWVRTGLPASCCRYWGHHRSSPAAAWGGQGCGAAGRLRWGYGRCAVGTECSPGAGPREASLLLGMAGFHPCKTLLLLHISAAFTFAVFKSSLVGLGLQHHADERFALGPHRCLVVGAPCHQAQHTVGHPQGWQHGLLAQPGTLWVRAKSKTGPSEPAVDQIRPGMSHPVRAQACRS